jgi:type IV pilus modification protein PilV
MRPGARLIVAPDVRVTGRRCRGFGLVEVLAALAISAIGLLGEALLLRHCLAAEGAALRHEQAAALLAGIAERIRMNAIAGADYALAPGASPPAAPACAASASCTPAQTAHADLAQWLADVARELPATAAAVPASISYLADTAGTDRLVLELHWAEPADATPASMSLSMLLAGGAP